MGKVCWGGKALMSFLLKSLINDLLEIGQGNNIFIYSLSIHSLCLACCPESFSPVVYYHQDITWQNGLEVSCAGIRAGISAGILILPFKSLLQNKLLPCIPPTSWHVKKSFQNDRCFCPGFCCCSGIVWWKRHGDVSQTGLSSETSSLAYEPHDLGQETVTQLLQL